MIILAVGMPRAGSGWHYNLIHDLVTANGGDDARRVRERYHLQGILTEVNCNIGVLSVRRLGMAVVPSLMGKTYALKAHSGPTRTSGLLQAIGQMRVLYIYRDPRDAMLSAFDYGQRAIAKGRPNAFSQLTGFEKTLDFMAEYVGISEAWLARKDALHTSYENFLQSYDAEARRIVEFLGYSAASPENLAVVEKYRPNQASSGDKGLHFFKGRIGRFREKYTEEQQALMAGRFGNYLQGRGYEI
ncbi:MAG: sulfotransferase domain-containing protein [Chloroflexota bacterium]